MRIKIKQIIELTRSSPIENGIDLQISGLKFNLLWHLGNVCVCEKHLPL